MHARPMADGGEGPLEGIERGKLAADMHRDAAKLEAGEGGRLGIFACRTGDLNAELALGEAGRNLGVRARLDPRIHSESRARLPPQRQCDFGQKQGFGAGLEVELADSRLETQPHFFARLANAGEDDLVRRDARGERALKLTGGDDVGAQPFRRERREHGGIGIGLDCISDQRIAEPAERLGKASRLLAHRAGGIDIDRRADRSRDLGQRHLLAMEHTAAQLKGAARNPLCHNVRAAR